MSRKPTPGSDDGVWGGILNDYLDVAHNPDGTLKSSSVQNSLASGGTVAVDLSQTGANATAIKVDGSSTTQPVSGIISSKTFDSSGNAISSTSGALDVNVKSTSGSQTVTGAVNVADPTTPSQKLAVDASGKLGINNFPATQPVSGTVTVQQPTAANLKVDLSGTSTNATAIKVDGSGTIQPVSGTVTANAGTGTFAVGGTVTSNIGTTNGLALDATLTGGTQKAQIVNGANTLAVDSSGQIAIQSGGTAGSTAPTRAILVGGTDGTNLRGLKTDASGNLNVTMASGSSTQITDGTNTANVMAGDSGQNAQLVAGNRKEVSFTTTTAQAVASTDVSNYRWVSVQITSQGTSSTVTFQASNDNASWVSVGLLNTASVGATSGVSSVTTTAIWAGPLSFRYFRLNVTGISAGTTAGIMELFSVAPSWPFGAMVATQSGTWTVQPGNTANSTPWLVSNNAATTGGATPYHFISAATTNATSVKGSAGQVYGIQAFNTNASPRFLKLYDKVSAPTVGTDTPVSTIVIPGNVNGAGVSVPLSVPKKFSNGIAFAITASIVDSDSTAIGANDCAINLDYA